MYDMCVIFEYRPKNISALVLMIKNFRLLLYWETILILYFFNVIFLKLYEKCYLYQQRHVKFIIFYYFILSVCIYIYTLY